MDKLQKVKVALRKSKRWFRAIFNQTFGFIELMEPIDILMEENRIALKFGGIASNEVIRRSLWEACWSDFSRDLANFSPSRRKAGNFPLILVGLRVLGLALVFPDNVKSQARWWTISKGIQAQLRSVITRMSRWWATYGLQVQPFSNQSGQLILLTPKGLEEIGILPKIYEKVLVIFQTVRDCDRPENLNTSLAIVTKIVKISGGRITSNSQIGIGSTFLFT
ncbi:hypothetical protein ACEYW6_07210 [Nostoc sp. UIC 10607]|uniref:hypothetical protein n=1 Tax=Nostoc sp. UIC 10607 TaxID=3045935 RepID=UPI0039A038D4